MTSAWPDAVLVRVSEHEVLLFHTSALSEAERQICLAAGCGGRGQNRSKVQWSVDPSEPPRIVRVRVPRTPTRGPFRTRIVIVGQAWLQKKRPKLWAVFVAARIAGLSADLFPYQRTHEDTRNGK